MPNEEMTFQIEESAEPIVIVLDPTLPMEVGLNTKQLGVKEKLVVVRVGVQAIRVRKILPMSYAKKEFSREKADGFVRQFGHGLPVEPFEVVWSKDGWRNGLVEWKDAPEKLVALREINYRIVLCLVKAARGSGVKVARTKLKRSRVEVVERPLTPEEMDV